MKRACGRKTRSEARAGARGSPARYPPSLVAEALEGAQLKRGKLFPRDTGPNETQAREEQQADLAFGKFRIHASLHVDVSR
jgi:hypothetical protein